MIDYVTLMLLNLATGLVLLAYFVFSGVEKADRRKWIPGFGAVGAIALTTGLHMTLTWPLSGSYNIAFGEMSVLYGLLFLMASICIAQNWNLLTVALYGFFAGLAAIIIGVRLYALNLTLLPWVSALGFILSGLGGVCAVPALYIHNKAFRLLGVAVLLGAAAIWFATGYGAYWQHLSDFSDWQPAPMR